MQELNEAEMFRSVLNEMLDELKQLQATSKEMNKTIIGQNQKIDGFDQRLENLQVVAPPPDLEPVKDQLAEGVSGLNKEVKEAMQGVQGTFTQHLKKLTDTLEAEPKPIVRRISLFPENDYHGNYKYFIKALFLWSLGILALVLAYRLIQPYFDRSTSYQVPSYRAAPYYPRDESASSSPVSSPRHSRKSSD